MEISQVSDVFGAYFSVCLIGIVFGFNAENSAVVLNSRPIFGVLLQEQHDNLHQYVASSYVKWLEMAGARVVSPLLYYLLF